MVNVRFIIKESINTMVDEINKAFNKFVTILIDNNLYNISIECDAFIDYYIGNNHNIINIQSIKYAYVIGNKLKKYINSIITNIDIYYLLSKEQKKNINKINNCVHHYLIILDKI